MSDVVIAAVTGQGPASLVHGMRADDSSLCGAVGLPDVRGWLHDQGEAIEFGDWVDGLIERRWPTCGACEAVMLDGAQQ